MSQTVVVAAKDTAVVTVEKVRTAVVERAQPFSIVVTRGVPGPPGRDGDAAGGALLVVNRLSEFDDETKKAAARTNLGLQVIDGGTFF